ncbi:MULTISPECIES: hypothetical protein [unclassified Bradyrhizobium]|uniref:hypothetical protein n=1 Tax=unclassified Bradyrhizobium TaxID=2631580 RepID=UPI000562D2C7|nr:MULTISPECIES: hypothetical protein [unclassified Bradyrhizobium]QIG92072.1 hypothetical protein G6P99_05855 [Bradyrhizobium sp. 6(2017)]
MSELQILNMPAKTLEGLRAKIRCAEAWSGGKIDSIDGCAEEMALSIIEGIENMAAAGTS